jgi:hypothetical protein
MHDAITRSTFAYATFFFVVLFAPQVGLEHHVTPSGPLISTFPDVFTLAAMLFVVWLAVRHGMAGHDDAPFARGFAKGAAVSCMGAILYTLGIAVVGNALFTTPGFAAAVAAGNLVIVAATGTAAAALFARWRVRGAPKPGGAA